MSKFGMLVYLFMAARSFGYDPNPEETVRKASPLNPIGN